MNSKPLHNQTCSELQTLIEDENRREEECRQFLKHVEYILFKETYVSLVYSEPEYRGHAGDSDYVISANVIDDRGSRYVVAYVWELKAPQCYIFDKETENRVKPSDDLIKAENQLINYHDELRGSDQTRSTFGVAHPDNIKLGGIVIGSTRTRVNGDFQDSKIEVLFKHACRIREKYFYNAGGIRLLTWSTILDYLRQSTISSQVREGDTTNVPTNKLNTDVIVGST